MTRDLSEISEIYKRLKENMKSNIEKYGIGHNPFPFRPTAEDQPKIYVGRNEQTNQVYSFILNICVSKQSSGLLLFGNYGMGKTHTLKYFRTELDKLSSSDLELNILPIYLTKPGTSFRNIYTEFFLITKDKIYQSIRDYVWRDLEKELRNKKRKYVSIFRSDIDDIPIPNHWFELVEHCKRLNYDPSKVTNFISNKLEPLIKNEVFRHILSKAVLEIEKENIQNLFTRFLCGDNLVKAEQKLLEISINSIENKEIPYTFKGLIDLLTLKFNAIILLIDEFEDWAEYPARKQRELLGELRTTFEIAENNVGWIIASVESMWDRINENYPAMDRRFPNKVRLPPLNRQEIEELILGYLNKAREESGKPIKDDFDPFQRDSISEINNFVSNFRAGRIDVILQICRDCFDLILTGREESISASLVRQIIGVQ